MAKDPLREIEETLVLASSLQLREGALADGRFSSSLVSTTPDALEKTLYDLARQNDIDEIFVRRALELRNVSLDVASADAKRFGAVPSTGVIVSDLKRVFLSGLQETLIDKEIHCKDNVGYSFQIGEGYIRNSWFRSFLRFNLWEKIIITSPFVDFSHYYLANQTIWDVTIYHPVVFRACGDSLEKFQKEYPEFRLVLTLEYTKKEL